MRQNQATLVFLVFALFSLTVLPRFPGHGMFLDGVHFASVARNLAEGVGTFWAPHYTETVYDVENEHPPLGFYLLSLAFRVFGDSLYVERFYGYMLGFVNISLLMFLWNRVHHGRDETSGPWLPAILYVALPMVSNAYADNLLENPMTVFDLLAAIVSYHALNTRERVTKTFLGLLAGTMIGLAVLTNGPAGSFVITLPLFISFFSSRLSLRSAAWVTWLNIVGMVTLAAVLILPNETAVLNTKIHYQRQVLGSLQGHGGTGSQFRVLNSLLREIAVPVSLCVITWLVTKVRLRGQDREAALSFCLVGLAGVLPFLLTTKQYRRYILPTLPFFAIALACVFNRLGHYIETRITVRSRRALCTLASVLCLLAGLSLVVRADVIHKHEAFHSDFSLQPLKLKGRPLISVCPSSLAQQWDLVANMQRQFKASLTAEPGSDLLLVEKHQGCVVAGSCRLVHPPAGRTYELYRCGGS